MKSTIKYYALYNFYLRLCIVEDNTSDNITTVETIVGGRRSFGNFNPVIEVGSIYSLISNIISNIKQ
jgi:hypothetical protein